MKDHSHDEVMAELFQADPSYAAELLAEIWAEGSADELAVLLRQLSSPVSSTGIFTDGSPFQE
ncbi:hypothetical protein [Pectobacterium carotovorum]|uniref:hypothetical protein n=1 Tax=Pectobacterium carotovorum TaxID=554 RepID=UPI00193D6701|nr:hypothetical protein [Pectobacterium carotovorum]QRN39505.1 hypothetical protein IHJ55_06380 [Pectobacterium carotovorum]